MAPLGIILLMLTPLASATTLSNFKILVVETSVIKELVSNFFFVMLFFLFVIYPAVSSTVLNTFNCIDLDEYGNWLKVDMRVQCPRDTLDTGFTWSVVFIFIYPVGIPVMFAIILWYFSVPKLAQQKQDFYRFKALISKLNASILPNIQAIASHLEKWDWRHDPVCLLTREECLIVLRHSWTAWEDFDSGGLEARVFSGRASNLVQEAAQKTADAVADAAEQVQDGFQETGSNDEDVEREDCSGVEGSGVGSDEAGSDEVGMRAGTQASRLRRSTIEEDMPTPLPREYAQASLDQVDLGISGSSFGSVRPHMAGSGSSTQNDKEAGAARSTPPAASPPPTASPRSATPSVDIEEEDDEYADMDEFDLRLSTKELVASLCKESVLVVAPIVWNSECGDKEELAIDRAGFLFSMYQVQYWWFEIFEICRKLLVNGVLVYIHDPHIRLGIGFAICFLSLILSFAVRPFASPKLNNLMLSGLSIQTLTLAYGMLLIIKSNVGVSTATSRHEMQALEWVIVLLNCLLIVFPYILSLVDLGISALKTLFINHTTDKEARYAYVTPGTHLFPNTTHVFLAKDKDGAPKIHEVSADIGFVGLQVAC